MSNISIPGREWLLENGRNYILEKLSRGERVYGMGVRGARTVDIAKQVRMTGHDWMYVDLEHSTMPVDTCAQICSAALDVGLISLVRVPERDYGIIGRVLDGGAVGIMAARMENAEQASEVAAACRFPPLGHRSQIGSLPLLGMRKTPARSHNDLVNRATLVMVLIESQAGVNNAREIAAVEGVDLICIGSNDLSSDMGVLGDYRHPQMRAAYEACIAACREAGKPLIVGGVRDAAFLREMLALGAASAFFTGIDTEIMSEALQGKINAFREI